MPAPPSPRRRRASQPVVGQSLVSWGDPPAEVSAALACVSAGVVVPAVDAGAWAQVTVDLAAP
ncbi:MAG: hypothetical protein R2939_19675 [Kofleriaceae bacterium]